MRFWFNREYLFAANMHQSGPIFRYDLAVANSGTNFITKGAPFSEYPSNIFVPFDMAIGPDGGLYVLPLNSNQVWRFNAQSGKYTNTLVHDAAAGSRGRQAYCITFGPDGNLYVGTQSPDQNDATSDVARFDGTTGAPLGPFVPSRSGGATGPRSMAFGPDGNFYFCAEDTNSVRRHDGVTGVFLDSFVNAGSGGLEAPQRLLFGPDKNLYVIGCSANGWPQTDRILRYNGTSGEFLGAFLAPSPQLGSPWSMTFASDGNLYVGSNFQISSKRLPATLRYGRIQAFHGVTGAFVRSLDSPGAAGLTLPFALALASPRLTLSDLFALILRALHG